MEEEKKIHSDKKDRIRKERKDKDKKNQEDRKDKKDELDVEYLREEEEGRDKEHNRLK